MTTASKIYRKGVAQSSKDGMPLAPGPVGVIQEGHYYMAAPNPDSLDSRYALVGWVVDSQIVGRGIKIF
ncbi:S26 family signal peptidase [Azovibrio restrictus]|uniref:S26 family signal peptidase n=1 Tax=Azovibrio restrictus TaxID=146938 RepID=UPI0026EBA8F8|nr:S26 family signal peptidase [Azovibrio restrictus]